MKRTLAAVLAAASALVLAGCSAGPGAGAPDAGMLRVVASTNVYGSLAAQVGGERVEVSSIIDSVAQDPHTYEAGARDRLAVQKADLVIENGGGYDAFMPKLRAGSTAPLITATAFTADPANEHVWFDLNTVTRVVEQIAVDLGELDPSAAGEFEANAHALIDALQDAQAQLAELRRSVEGTPVLMTEPLPGYLAEAAGLRDVTPTGFASAVEEGNDVPPAILLSALRLIEHGEAAALLVNAQTGGSETARLEKAAKAEGIPVIEFREILPDDQSYAEWMHDAIQSIAVALHR